MDVKKKIIPVICVMSAYLHWLKPRMLSMSASKDGKSLLLNLCGRSRFLIPMIVFTAFWLFDAQMDIEASVSLTLSRNMRITLGPDDAQRDVEANDDDDDNNETYSVESYTDDSSYSLSSSLIAFEEIESALTLQHELEDVNFIGVEEREFTISAGNLFRLVPN